MGRALFSLVYAPPHPAVRTVPEVEPYGRWSIWNRFDPDSDEFFQDAEYEAFIDPVHVPRQRAVVTLEPSSDSERTAESSESGDSSDSEQASPVVPGSEIPVVLGGRLYNNRPLPRTYPQDNHPEWIERSSSPSSFVSSSTSLLPVHSPVSPQSPDVLDSPPFIPPLSFRQRTLDTEEPRRRIDLSLSPPLRRTIPINVSRVRVMPATRSPSPPSAPATPPSQTTPLSMHNQSQAMLTPSPPPSVTPRFYSWQNHPIPSLPTSPAIIRGNVFTRRETTPARVHIPSAVV